MNVFKFELKRNIKSCLLWSAICGALIIFFLSVFPSMKDLGMQELVGGKLDALPEGMLKALGLENMLDFTDIIQYLAYSLQYIAMAAYIYALILGVNSLLEEESKGTIEFLYSKNISRTEIVNFKLISRITLLAIFLILVFIITILIAIVFKPDNLENIELLTGVTELFLGMSFVAFIFLCIGFLLSTILKPHYNFTAISIGFFFITYVIGIAGKLRENLSFLRFFSPYDYAMATEVVKKGYDTNYIIIGVVIIVVSLGLTYLIYKRKDMKI